MEIAQRISTALTTSIDIGNDDVDLRVSIGVVWTTEAIDTDVLIAQADSAMYQAKRLGDHGVTLYDGPHTELCAEKDPARAPGRSSERSTA